MKAIAINGSPRKDGNTAKLVKEALRGAADAGAQTAYVDLCSLDYRGCASCFARKRIGHASCVCRISDGLRPLLEEIHQADALILGSPIYFGDVTSGMQAFLERLAFPALSYDDFGSIYDGTLRSGFIFTMNVDDASAYEPLMKQKAVMLSNLGGAAEVLPATFTVQFDDYTKYHAAGLNGPARIERKAVQFPMDLKRAYDLGIALVSPDD